MSEESKRKATQVDTGWRSADEKSHRNATQVDNGWRRDNDVEKKATQIDTGWRENADNGRTATQVDAGWRRGSKATEVDEGWRQAYSLDRKATQVDVGWRKEIEDTLNPTDIMNNATANYFNSIDKFKDEVEKLSELRSSNGNIFPIKRTISRSGGESIILLCADPNGNDVVAKVYYEPVNGAGSSISSRAKVLEYMGTEEGRKYTLAVTEIGLVDFGDSKYYFEIMPYCDSTDLSDDGAYSFAQIVEITHQLNEALHSIHQLGIYHLDIKPENLYSFDGIIKLGDFGIARNASTQGSHVTVHIMGTEGYRAPEATRYVYGAPSDYYSLGVTLASLFEGHYIFENMTYAMQTLAQESEHLPLVRLDPNREQLENLLNGLCRINPRQRFGYEEVNRWLADHNYSGGGDDEEWPKAFRLLGESYRDERSLFYGITKDEEHWEEAKKMLYRKIVEQFFMSFRTDLARSAQIADELYRTDDSDKGLAVFLKSLFAPGPLVWKGNTFYSLEELANKMVDTKEPSAYSRILQSHCVSHWLSNTEGIAADDVTMQLVDDIEELSSSEPEVACYWFGNSFAKERTLSICNRNVKSVNELISALFDSPKLFYQADGYKKLIDKIVGADLYGFLYSLGYKELVENGWEELESCDLFNKITILLSMIDNVAVISGDNPEPVRTFFVHYGPAGIATYTKKLVDDNVYIPLDGDGKQILNKISSFTVPVKGDVAELFRTYSPLFDSVEKLRRNLVENPHCILTGVYDNKGIIYNNLTGCFAFNIFDRVAPLGFNALLATNGGI